MGVHVMPDTPARVEAYDVPCDGEGCNILVTIRADILDEWLDGKRLVLCDLHR